MAKKGPSAAANRTVSKPTTSGNYLNEISSFDQFPAHGGRDPKMDNLFGNLRPRTFGPDTSIISSNDGDTARGFGSTAGLNLGTRLSRAFQSSGIDEILGSADELLARRGGLSDEAYANISRQAAAFGNVAGAGITDPNIARATAIGQEGFASSLQDTLAKDKVERERSDLSQILGGLFIEPSVALAEGGEMEAVRQAEQRAGRSAAADAKSQQRKQAVAGFVSAILPIIAAMCWVARRVLGADNPDWLAVRAWMLDEAPTELFLNYGLYGEATADRLTDEEADELRPLFEQIAKGEL